MSDYDRATGIAPDSKKETPAAAMVAASRLPHQQLGPVSEPAAGVPLRQAPVVQRVFIKRFVDENDSLQDDVVVYREVKGPRWTGFDGTGQEMHAPGAYPHRIKGNSSADSDLEQPMQQTNLAQQENAADSAAGSAISTATTKAER